jgi:hypothetical protein
MDLEQKQLIKNAACCALCVPVLAQQPLPAHHIHNAPLAASTRLRQGSSALLPRQLHCLHHNKHSPATQSLARRAPVHCLSTAATPLTLTAHVPRLLTYPSYGYDPLGLGKDSDTLAKYRANELIHARWAMLAAAGIIIPEGLQVGGGRLGGWGGSREGAAFCLQAAASRTDPVLSAGHHPQSHALSGPPIDSNPPPLPPHPCCL